MSLPDKQLLRRGEVMAFLGISSEALSALVANGAVEAVQLGGKRAFFKRDEVLALVRPKQNGTHGAHGTNAATTKKDTL
jgi:predicted DNA-binding transcriptional regulator AlpA